MKKELSKTRTLRRRMTILALVIVAVALVFFFVLYGSWKVIPGMDTMLPDLPPGTTCVIYKNPRSVAAGNVVVIELPGGAGLLSRVDRVEGDSIYLRHDNRESKFVDYEAKPYPMSSVRGLILTSFVPERRPVSKGSRGGH